jgi:hypothetical protein
MELTTKYIAVVLAVLVIAALTSCNRVITETNTRTIQDSTEVTIETKWKDTTIYIAADTAITVVKVICDSNLVPYLEQNGKRVTSVNSTGKRNASISIDLANGYLKGIAECDSISKDLQLSVTLISKLKSRIETLEKTQIKLQEYTPPWKQALAWIGGFALALIVIITIIKFIK